MALTSRASRLATRGVCRRAKIAGVLISLPQADQDRRLSFYDSSRVADAVDYLLRLGQKLKLQVSINVSLGNQRTLARRKFRRDALDRRGAGDARPRRHGCRRQLWSGKGRHEDDLGWIMGRIHASGQIPAAISRRTRVGVVGNGIMDLSENEWRFGTARRIGLRSRSSRRTWIGLVLSRRASSYRTGCCPTDDVQRVQRGVQSANGLNYISVYLSPFLKKAGHWRAGRRVDRAAALARGALTADCTPGLSATTRSGLDGLAIASVVVSLILYRAHVGGRHHRQLAGLWQSRDHGGKSRRGQESNQCVEQSGPDRDGRAKPDIAAQGTTSSRQRVLRVSRTNGWRCRAPAWQVRSSTGVVGLMLAVEPRLTAAQIESIIRRTAKPLPGASFTWSNAAGFGVIDPEACLVETSRLNLRKDLG
jgi:hypothetical protein